MQPHDHHHSDDEQPEGRAGGTPGLVLLPQEIPHDDPASRYYFRPSAEKPFAVTPAAAQAYGMETILACLYRLQVEARQHHGLGHLQIFQDSAGRDELWFIEDDDGGTITALLATDY